MSGIPSRKRKRVGEPCPRVREWLPIVVKKGKKKGRALGETKNSGKKQLAVTQKKKKTRRLAKKKESTGLGQKPITCSFTKKKGRDVQEMGGKKKKKKKARTVLRWSKVEKGKG